MQTFKKILSSFLALMLLLSALSLSMAASGACLSAKAGAKTQYSTTQGEMLNISLSELFADADGHTLSYSLEGDWGEHTKIADGILTFTNSTAGEYKPVITATCSGGKTASVQLTIAVTEAEEGDPTQYSYDETDASSVAVYVTVSSDGVPIQGDDGTVISHLKVEVPYFDLSIYNLSEYYRYHTENGSGAYINDVVVQRPTALHLYLYMLGRYYLGYSTEEIVTGMDKKGNPVSIVGASGAGEGVLNMNDDVAYEDTNLALNITGSATSMYMQQFWGHDENLMYYRNHVYPLMSAGWGSTADYILLSDGDTIDVAMFSDWNFYSDGGAFAKFDRDEYTAAKNGTITFSTLKYDTKSVSDGGAETFTPITGLNVAVYSEDWQEIGTAAQVDEDGNTYSYTFTKPGTYYLMARDARTGADARIAPATACVTVTDGIRGDADGNGRAELADAVLAYKYSCGQAGVTLSDAAKACADMDGDGRITAKDAAMISALVKSNITE